MDFGALNFDWIRPAAFCHKLDKFDRQSFVNRLHDIVLLESLVVEKNYEVFVPQKLLDLMMRLTLNTFSERCAILAALKRQLQSPVIKVAEIDIL